MRRIAVTNFMRAVCCAVASSVSWGSPAVGTAPSAGFNGVGVARPPDWTVIPSSDNREIRIRVDCSGFSAVEVAGGYSLRIPGQASSANPGTPDVPRLARLLTGIKGERAVLTIQGRDPTNVTDVAVAAAEGYRLDVSGNQGRSLKSYRQRDAALYQKDQFWPVQLGTVEEAWVGTQKVVRVECCPVQYNPTRGTIRFYRSLEGSLRFVRTENSAPF